MPKHDDAPTEAVCDGCAMAGAGKRFYAIDATDLRYCPDCAGIRADDPPITIHGRTLLLSEMVAQAEAGDKDLFAALTGDTVQDQIKAARKR